MSLPSALQPNNLSDREDASIMTNLSISRTAYSGISENLHETIDKPGIPPDIPPFGDQEERYDWITSILRVVAHGITRQEEDSLHAHKSSGEMEDEKNGPGSQELDTSKVHWLSKRGIRVGLEGIEIGGEGVIRDFLVRIF